MTSIREAPDWSSTRMRPTKSGQSTSSISATDSAAAAREIDLRGWRTKQWVTKSGQVLGGKPFTTGSVYRLLVNPTYAGQVVYRGQVYRGEHDAILEAHIWENVQAILHRRVAAPIEGTNGDGAAL